MKQYIDIIYYLPVRGRIKEAAMEMSLQLLITKFVHTNTLHDKKRSSTSEQALWEINKSYPIHSYGILVINTVPQSL